MAIKVACPNPDCKAEYQVPQDRLGQKRQVQQVRAEVHAANVGRRNRWPHPMPLSRRARGPGGKALSPPAGVHRHGEGPRMSQSPSPETPAVQLGRPRDPRPSRPQPPRDLPAKIGQYQIKRLLGAGGDGARLPGPRPAPRSRRGVESPAPRVDRRRGAGQPLPPRGPADRQDPASQHGGHSSGRWWRTGLASIVMEFVDGGSLDEIVEKRGPMPWREATRAIRDAAAGLAPPTSWAWSIATSSRPTSCAPARGPSRSSISAWSAPCRAPRNLRKWARFWARPPTWPPSNGWARRPTPAATCIRWFAPITISDRQGAVSRRIPFRPWATSTATSRFPRPRKLVSDLPPAACRILARGTQKDPAQRFQTAAELIARWTSCWPCRPMSWRGR